MAATADSAIPAPALGGPQTRRSARSLEDWLAEAPGYALLIGVAAAYLVLAQLVIWLRDPVPSGTAVFWPAAGLSLGLLLLIPTRLWPWVLGGVAIAEFGGDLVRGYPLGGSMLWTVGNVVEPLVGAVLIRRLVSPSGSLTPVTALIGFIAFGAIAGPLVGATIGSIGTILFANGIPTVVWPQYFVGDGLGVLVVAPVLLSWSHPSANRSRLEAVLLAVSATAVTVLVFSEWGGTWALTLPYFIVPFVMWAGLRFGIRGASLIGLLIAGIGNVATAFGIGPFTVLDAADHGTTLLQVFLGVEQASGLVLASLASDLTDSREMARRQAAHTAEIERTREFRDAFLGVLSHEIRSPITTLYGMTELLRTRRHTMDPEKVGEQLDDIGAEAERLRRLTEDLLVLSRAEGGRLEVAPNPISVGPLVRAAAKAEGARATSHEIDVETSYSLPIVLGEDVYVEQVLRNYLGNAAKYSPPGTTIRVTADAEDGGAAVRVIDAGPGLPDGPADRLFELFYRAPEASASTSGAGIGLFVCRKLVEAMNGRVWARPAETGGAEFGFWLPAASDEELHLD